MILVSPTEPAALRQIGITSPLPEEYGADIMWSANNLRYGVQRKEFPNDFLASWHDGRLTEQVHKGEYLDFMILILEGKPHWTTTGQLMRDNGGKRWPYDRALHRKVLATIQSKGVQVHTSDGLYDTIDVVKALAAWSETDEHMALEGRPGPPKDQWNRRTNTTWQKWFLQGLPGVGPKQAEAIIHTIGFPFQLIVDKESLMSVPGIGKGRAEKILKVFE